MRVCKIQIFRHIKKGGKLFILKYSSKAALRLESTLVREEMRFIMSGTGQDRRQVSFAVSGANRMEIDDFVGHSVRDVRRGLRDALNIAQNSAVLVGRVYSRLRRKGTYCFLILIKMVLGRELIGVTTRQLPL